MLRKDNLQHKALNMLSEHVHQNPPLSKGSKPRFFTLTAFAPIKLFLDELGDGGTAPWAVHVEPVGVARPTAELGAFLGEDEAALPAPVRSLTLALQPMQKPLQRVPQPATHN
ncbi:MAG: hypothetical protein QXJ40_03510 [Candidatus Bathyarchaeia archaeon]